MLLTALSFLKYLLKIFYYQWLSRIPVDPVVRWLLVHPFHPVDPVFWKQSINIFTTYQAANKCQYHWTKICPRPRKTYPRSDTITKQTTRNNRLKLKSCTVLKEILSQIIISWSDTGTLFQQTKQGQDIIYPTRKSARPKWLDGTLFDPPRHISFVKRKFLAAHIPDL